jgi:hypothetical protein
LRLTVVAVLPETQAGKMPAPQLRVGLGEGFPPRELS